MTLTPEEIVSYDLKQSVRGYSVAQVDELLDRLADQVEAEQHERERLAARVREAETRLEATQETESTLKRTLVTAQQAAERSLEEAREEADALLARAREEAGRIEEDARLEAERVLADARARATREAEEARRRRAALQERVDELVERERRHRQRLRELLERELAELEQLEEVDGADEVPGTASGEDAAGQWGHDAIPSAPAESGTTGHEDDPVSRPGGEDSSGPGSHGLTVRVHDRPGDRDDDSPLGSASLPGEE